MAQWFQVKCDDCSLACEVHGRDHAERLAHRHSTVTGHDVVAVELPPNLAST